MGSVGDVLTCLEADKDEMSDPPSHSESDARSIGQAAGEIHTALTAPLFCQLVRNFGSAASRAIANLRISAPTKTALQRGAPPLQRLSTESVAALQGDEGGRPAAFDRFGAEQRAVVARLAGAEVFARDVFNACQLPRSPMEAAALADGDGPDFDDYVDEALAALRPYVRHRRYLRR